jgi:hypothetical protein
VRWEYRVVIFKIYDVGASERQLRDFGVAGWELVTLPTTVKTWLNVTGDGRGSVDPVTSETSPA